MSVVQTSTGKKLPCNQQLKYLFKIFVFNPGINEFLRKSRFITGASKFVEILQGFNSQTLNKYKFRHVLLNDGFI